MAWQLGDMRLRILQMEAHVGTAPSRANDVDDKVAQLRTKSRASTRRDEPRSTMPRSASRWPPDCSAAFPASWVKSSNASARVHDGGWRASCPQPIEFRQWTARPKSVEAARSAPARTRTPAI
jgi:hypothetical protein